MFAALLRGKLSPTDERKEDVLTSNVFGTFAWLNPNAALSPFLQGATNLHGAPLSLPDDPSVSLAFWPWLTIRGAKSAEPDVLIRFGSPGSPKTSIVLIESKFLSDKSSFPSGPGEPVNDQLAREMLHVKERAQREGFGDFAVVYVTAHTAFPERDVAQASHELAQKVGESYLDRFYWTSWQRLSELLPYLAESAKTQVEQMMLTDLLSVLNAQNLTRFDGVKMPGPLEFSWRLSARSMSWTIDGFDQPVWSWRS